MLVSQVMIICTKLARNLYSVAVLKSINQCGTTNEITIGANVEG